MADPEGTSGRPVVLELRIHGVRGTPPAVMLGVEPGTVDQVAGDGITGVFRIADDENPPLRKLPSAMAVEAYSWAGLTSSTRGFFGWLTRLLWLMLLPFALVNLAYWARLDVGEGDARARAGLRLVRVAGLLLTMCLILSVCVGSIDLFGWQCFRGNALQCSAIPGPAQFAVGWTAGQRLAFFSLVPVAAIGLLYLLSRVSLARYEDATLRGSGPRPPWQGRVLFQHPLMWHGDCRARRLQRLHVATALSTVACFTGAFVVDNQWGRFAPVSRLVVVTTIAAALLLLASIVTILRVHECDVEYRSGRLAGAWRLRPAAGGRRRGHRDPPGAAVAASRRGAGRGA